MYLAFRWRSVCQAYMLALRFRLYDLVKVSDDCDDEGMF